MNYFKFPDDFVSNEEQLELGFSRHDWFEIRKALLEYAVTSANIRPARLAKQIGVELEDSKRKRDLEKLEKSLENSND